jgi:hypothetical protein
MSHQLSPLFDLFKAVTEFSAHARQHYRSVIAIEDLPSAVRYLDSELGHMHPSAVREDDGLRSGGGVPGGRRHGSLKAILLSLRDGV